MKGFSADRKETNVLPAISANTALIMKITETSFYAY